MRCSSRQLVRLDRQQGLSRMKRNAAPIESSKSLNLQAATEGRAYAAELAAGKVSYAVGKHEHCEFLLCFEHQMNNQHDRGDREKERGHEEEKMWCSGWEHTLQEAQQRAV